MIASRAKQQDIQGLQTTVEILEHLIGVYQKTEKESLIPYIESFDQFITEERTRIDSYDYEELEKHLLRQ